MSKKEKRNEASSSASKKDRQFDVKAALIWTGITVGVLAVLFGIAAFAAIGYERLYAGRIFPGVRILDVRLDGLSENEARLLLNERIDTVLRDGIRFTYRQQDIALGASTISTAGGDASRDLIRIGIEDALQYAVKYGRDASPFLNAVRQWQARIHPKRVDAEITLDDDGIREGILHAVESLDSPPKDADIEASWDETSGRANVRAVDGSEGNRLLIDQALAELHRQAKTLSFQPIVIQESSAAPDILLADVEPLISTAESWIGAAPLTLTYEDRTFEVSKDMLASWLHAERKSGSIRLSMDSDQFYKDIRSLTGLERIAKKGSLEIKDGVIVSFEAGTSGLLIEDTAMIENIVSGLPATSTFPVVVKKEEAALAGDDTDSLGIREIIGIGTSDFSGSPTNRRKNIALGVSRVNGSLIAPGEEFSLLKTLGPITADKGWLPELVIKGNKTVPELGGGLCQIGTTTFRAALHSGLKITQRQNHSYRVRYYEPAGTDATIYEPSPDFRFVNDTAHHVYINAYITGDIITYEFWGTKDGRQAIVADPRIYNIVSPPPTKLVETLDLSPGQKKCTESAHNGADASLDYKVVYADGTTHEETFNSHYRPWQAVCLIGVEKLSEPEPESPSDAPDQPQVE